jgi:hypothetical protein
VRVILAWIAMMISFHLIILLPLLKLYFVPSGDHQLKLDRWYQSSKLDRWYQSSKNQKLLLILYDH